MEEKLKDIETKDTTSFTDIVDVTYITPENSQFTLHNGRFLHLVSEIDTRPEFAPEEGGGHRPGPRGGHFHRREPKKAEIKFTDDGRRDYGRVVLHRAFPFDNPTRIISVQDEEGNEIGIIRDLADFDENTRAELELVLDKKYFIPEIKKIISAKDRFGFLYCKCETDCGICEFVIRNPYSNIIHSGEKSVFIIDIDGNRYAISDVSALDKKSYRKIELYL